MSKNSIIGKTGEKATEYFISRRGGDVMEMNYSTSFGEVDMIYRDSNGDVVFVEVKTRSSTKIALPCEAVNLKKQRKIISVAREYIARCNLYGCNIRFDVSEVYINERKIRYIKDAFLCNT